jgi:TetR/AcrR family transcriptional repressor of nem operon
MPVRRPARATQSRNLEKSRKEILGAAFGEVYLHGFQGVSIDDIVRKTSLTKGAFYHHFPTKLDLGYAIVDDILTPLVVERWVAPLKQYANPLEGIERQMECLIGRADPSSLRTGCPLNNLIQEMAPLDRGFRTRLQGALTRWIRELEIELKRGQKTGFVRRDVKTTQAAHYIVMLHEGIFGLLKGLDDAGAFRMLFASVKEYLRSIEVKPTPHRAAPRRA